MKISLLIKYMIVIGYIISVNQGFFFPSNGQPEVSELKSAFLILNLHFHSPSKCKQTKRTQHWEKNGYGSSKLSYFSNIYKISCFILYAATYNLAILHLWPFLFHVQKIFGFGLVLISCWEHDRYLMATFLCDCDLAQSGHVFSTTK